MNSAQMNVYAVDLDRTLCNLNTVDAEHIRTNVPGIKKLADRIIKYRNSLPDQQFQSLSQLSGLDWISTGRSQLIHQFYYVNYQPPQNSVDGLTTALNQLSLRPEGRVTISWPGNQGAPHPN